MTQPDSLGGPKKHNAATRCGNSPRIPKRLRPSPVRGQADSLTPSTWSDGAAEGMEGKGRRGKVEKARVVEGVITDQEEMDDMPKPGSEYLETRSE
jgi:hypothetical protein